MGCVCVACSVCGVLGGVVFVWWVCDVYMLLCGVYVCVVCVCGVSMVCVVCIHSMYMYVVCG